METKENKLDIHNVAVIVVENKFINDATLRIFKERGNGCFPVISHNLYCEDLVQCITMRSDGMVEIMEVCVAEEKRFTIMNPSEFVSMFGEGIVKLSDIPKPEPENKGDNLPTPEEIFGNEEPEEKENKKFFPFPFAFFGEKEPEKSEIIERVFHKHGLCKEFHDSFRIEMQMYGIQDERTVLSKGNARFWIELGFEVTTIDNYIKNHPEDKDCIPEPEDESEKMLDQMEVKPERIEAFKQLAGEIRIFLNQPFCHPHMTIIADCNHVELVEGVQCESFIKQEE